MRFHAILVQPAGESSRTRSGRLGQVVPLVINATGDFSCAELAAALEQAFGPGPYTADGHPLQGRSAAAGSLLNGVVLAPTAHTPAAARVDPPPLVLVTHSGPDAGRIIELRRGRYRLGRPGLAPLSGSRSIEFRDPALSRLHAELLVSARGIQITDAASQNGVWVDGRRVRKAELSTASLVTAGNTTFQVCIPESVRPPTGSRSFAEPLTVPVKPPGPHNPAMLLAALLALGLGIIMALMTGMWMFLAFSALTALTAFGGFAGLRRRTRRFRAAAARTAAADKTRRRLAHPTAGDRALAALQASLPGPEQPQKLPRGAPATPAPPLNELRLGTGTMPANIKLLQAPTEGWTPPLLDDVPVTFVPSAGANIRVTGPAAETMGMLRSVLLQLAASHPGGARPILVLCRDADRFSSDARLLPGVQLLSTRDIPAAAKAIQAAAGRNASAVLTVLVPPSVSAEAGLLRAGLADEIRKSAVFLIAAQSDGPRPAPADANGDVSITLSGDSGIFSTAGTELPFQPDLIGPLAFHRTAMRLASAGAHNDQPAGPPALFPMSSDGIGATWAGNGAPHAALGYQGANPVSLGLLTDGPHFLIAGTTGSGKSELLRTFIISLAATVPPTMLNFLLIDFKGGSGLAPLARLPHTAGLLTDLSGESVVRTLTSLRSELRRREALLSAAGASDLDGFNGTAPLPAAIPRLIVIVDEFRMLADTVPNAVEDLMRIAVLGRSLGLHLVLATQRPQGAVTADIRANISTSVCLRVQSALESRDVVGCDYAADIPAGSPGSAIVRKAGSAAFAFTVSSTASGRNPPPRVQTLAQYLSAPPDLRDTPPGSSLEELVEAVNHAASAAGFPAEAAAPVQPPLPHSLPHGAHGHGTRGLSSGHGSDTTLCLGLADRPEQQRQDPLEWAPDRDSHLAVIGPGQSGTESTTALLAAEHLAGFPARHLYVLDGDGSLAWTASHAQTGAYVAPHETRRAARVLAVLGGIILQRLARGRGGTSRTGDPGITLLVSGWGRWQEAFRSSRFPGAEEDILALARDGEGAGVCLVISGNRELLTARFFQLIPNRLWFPAGLPDDALVAWPRMPLMEPVPGRAYVQGRIGAPSGAVAQCAEPPESAERTPIPGGSAVPQRVDALPGFAVPANLAPASGPDRFPLGLHGDELDTAEAYLPSGSTFLALGPPGSGRTMLLRQFAHAAGPGMTVHHFNPGCDEATRMATGAVEPPPEDQNIRNRLILVDDADRLPLEAHPCLTQLLDRGARLVLAAAPGFGLASRLPLAARLRADPRGALLAPGQQTDAEFFGIRLTLDGSPRPGRGYLVAGAKVTEVQFACPD